MKEIAFVHDTAGCRRPQVLLLGNGPERTTGQAAWDALLEKLRAPGVRSLTETEKNTIPFPLQYQLLSTPSPAPCTLSEEEILQEEHRLRDGVRELCNSSNALLDRLPALGLDHIMTTNYTYSLEAAFFPKRNYLKCGVRNTTRFNLSRPDKDGVQRCEREYRLHSGYLARNADGSPVGLWHVHGEISVPRGIVVGHDRYGRLLSRMETVCAREAPHPKNAEPYSFCSWPVLFLYADVYVLGFGFELCEYDLWWLLRRKQRERYADGKVYFYDNGKSDKAMIRRSLLEAHGVRINPGGICPEASYEAFYEKAIDAIARQIRENRRS